MQIRFGMRLSAILIFDGGIDVHDVCFGIQGIQDVLVAFFHKLPAQFPGSGQFVIVGVKFIVKIGELDNTGGFRQILVGLANLFFHQIIDFRFLGKLMVVGIGEFFSSAQLATTE